MDAAHFSGRLLRRGDAHYDTARALHNGLIDKHPALIAQCRTRQEVVDALALAAHEGLAVTVHGGGHNVAGRALNDGGLVIDLSPMRAISIDAGGRRARVEGGATWGEFNAEAQRFALATTGGVVSSTGVGGLTLGGGLGWLMGKHGLAVDNLAAADVVLADGSHVRATESEHPDLFWGLRGGGGSLGVVTQFDFHLHPVGPTITGGMVVHHADATRDVLRFFREYTRSLPDDLTMAAALTYAPDGSGTPVVALLMCHAGTVDDGAQHASALRTFGAPLMVAVGPMPYCDLNGMLDAGFPRGARSYWKSRMLDAPSDQVADRMAAAFGRSPSLLNFIVLEHIHGEAARRRADACAFPHRGEGYSLLVISQWLDPADDTRGIAWARETYAALEPSLRHGGYVNYLGAEDDGDSQEAAFGSNLSRLREIKRRYDPAGIFRT